MKLVFNRWVQSSDSFSLHFFMSGAFLISFVFEIQDSDLTWNTRVWYVTMGSKFGPWSFHLLCYADISVKDLISVTNFKPGHPQHSLLNCPVIHKWSIMFKQELDVPSVTENRWTATARGNELSEFSSRITVLPEPATFLLFIKYQWWWCK